MLRWKIQLFFGFAFLLMLKFACKTSSQNTSSVSAEGLFALEGSFLNVLHRHGNLLDLNLDQRDKLQKLFRNAISATFRIQCGRNIGTGFFIGEKGLFITANHVIATPQKKCKLNTHSVVANHIQAEMQTSSVKILYTNSVAEFESDITVGIAESISNSSFLTVTDQESVNEESLLYAFGFPPRYVSRFSKEWK